MFAEGFPSLSPVHGLIHTRSPASPAMSEATSRRVGCGGVFAGDSPAEHAAEGIRAERCERARLGRVNVGPCSVTLLAASQFGSLGIKATTSANSSASANSAIASATSAGFA